MRNISLRTRNEAHAGVIDGLNNHGNSDLTGFSRLDTALGGGLYPGKAYGLQARKKIGKTIFMGSLSYNLNQNEVPHLWLACEMSDRELEQRHLARALNRNALDFLRAEDPNLEDEILMYQATTPDYIKYANVPGLTIRELQETVDKAVEEEDIHGFFLDYLQLVSGGNGDRVQHLENVANAVVELVKRHNIWAVVAAQLNQEDNTRGGEGMLLAFDMVFTLRREKFEENAWLEMMETRYTSYLNVGDRDHPGLILDTKGPHFREP